MDLPCLSTPNTLMVSKSQRILFHLSKVRNIFIDLISLYICMHANWWNIVGLEIPWVDPMCRIRKDVLYWVYKFSIYILCSERYVFILASFFIINIDIGTAVYTYLYVYEYRMYLSIVPKMLDYIYVWSAVPTYWFDNSKKEYIGIHKKCASSVFLKGNEYLLDWFVIGYLW